MMFSCTTSDIKANESYLGVCHCSLTHIYTVHVYGIIHVYDTIHEYRIANGSFFRRIVIYIVVLICAYVGKFWKKGLAPKESEF